MRSRTILSTASSAKYQPDIQWFAVRLNQITNMLALAQEAFSVRKHDRQSGWVNNNANRYKMPLLDL